MRKWLQCAGWLLFFFSLGCESAAVQKTAKPVVAPIKKTSEAVFRERKIGSDTTAQAVLFPREEEQEKKHFKVKF